MKRSFLKLVSVCFFLFTAGAQSDPTTALAQENSSAHSSPITITADENFVWSVNTDLDSITVLRTSSDFVEQTISVGDEPRSIAVTPRGDLVYVANAAGNSVSVIRVNITSSGEINAYVDTSIGQQGEIVTGAEPRALVADPLGEYVFVANRNQGTVSVISTQTQTVTHALNLNASICNVGDRDRVFQPGALSISNDGKDLFVTRYISYTKNHGVQRDDFGKEGIVCKISISRNADKKLLTPNSVVKLPPQETGFQDTNLVETYAFPNQLQSIVLRGGRAYLPNIAASPSASQTFDTITQSFVNIIDTKYNNGQGKSLGAINIHLGGRDPEPGKPELYFANPSAIAFDSDEGVGSAYVLASGSDIVVKLRVDVEGNLDFTVDKDTTRYIDLNDPDSSSTNGANAGKNPLGIVISKINRKAYVLNYISRNISILDLNNDIVDNVVKTADLPEPGSVEERLLVGAEMFYSSRGNFVPGDERLSVSSRNRLSEKGRQNCASCHAGGLTDGVIWQFATGPRKTIPINGTFNPHDPDDQRIINATAIFDEVEDADFNTRFVSSKGLLDTPQLCIDSEPYIDIGESRVDPDHGLILGEWGIYDIAACLMNAFERPNANRPQPYVQLPGSDMLVKSHDALVEWQKLAVRTLNRPLTRGELSAAGAPIEGGLNDDDIISGRQLFAEAGCTSCHAGGKWTNSTKDFVSPPDPSEITTEFGAENANQAQYLHRFLRDIGSYTLNVAGSGNYVNGYRAIGGEETDKQGRDALGFDHNGDGLGNGYNPYSLLGIGTSAPYYHNGACETLECVLADKNHRVAGGVDGKDPLQSNSSRKLLAEFLKSIDETTPLF